MMNILRFVVRVGNGVLCFLSWSPKITKLAPAVLDSNRWIRVWGLPLTSWSHDSFQRIGDYCGHLTMMDLTTVSRSILSYARIKVEAESLNCNPRHMIFFFW